MKLSSYVYCLSYLSPNRPPLEDVCTIEVNIKVCIELFIVTIMVHYGIVLQCNKFVTFTLFYNMMLTCITLI